MSTTGQSQSDLANMTVEELEKALREHPEDRDIKYELLYALVFRHFERVGAHDRGADADLARIREFAVELGDGPAYANAYLAHLDNDHEALKRWLANVPLEWSREQVAPPSSDVVFLEYLVVLHLGAEDWHTLATALEETWPGCAAALVAQGMTASRREDYAAAIDSYAAALDRDPSYWLASWLTATAYSAQGNWRAASRSYQQALSSEEAQGYAALHFEFAWCSQRLRDYETAVKHYLSCLEIAPDFQYARNNLGWSLLKLKRFEEALKAFEEAIRQHTPGRYALRNKARALEGLGRYDEAIATLREDTYRGALTKYAKKSIAIIERARARRDAGQLPTEGEPPADEELEEQDQVAEEEAVSPPAARSKERSIAREVWLEELLEEQIHREGAAFGRKLRVYDHTKGYGRQFAIPYLGRIDLLAEDLETGDLVVIELKRAQGHEEVVGQIALYMAWVREHLAEAGQGVHGIICASDVSERLRLAAASVPNLELHEYGLGLHKVS